MSKIKKALVTGAAGFIGSAVCCELASRGTEVIALVRREAPALLEIGGVRTVICDMADYGKLDKLISDRDIDVFFHFAWRGVAGAERADKDIQLANVAGACDAVAGCAALRCGRFVYASSIHENEIAAFMSSERAPAAGTIYSSAKLAANYMARATAAKFGVSYLQGRITNAYGPGERSERLVIASLRKLARGERCAFTPGEQLYDFIYVTDAAKAFVAIAEHGAAGRCYYLGSGHPRPLRDFLLDMGDAVGARERIGLGDLPYNGVSFDYSQLDLGVLERDTGFAPEVDFETGIRLAFEWVRSQEGQTDGV